MPSIGHTLSAAAMSLISGYAGYHIALITEANKCDITLASATAPIPSYRSANVAKRISPKLAEDQKPLPWFPKNNEVAWSITVSPGTPTGMLLIDEQSQTLNRMARIKARRNGKEIEVAALAIRAGKAAVISLPKGRYEIEVQGWQIDQQFKDVDPRLLNKPIKASVETGARSTIMLFHGNGQYLQPNTSESEIE